ncbi:hypothetical protein DYB30_003013 [Aphanomyces astaci]|uniref:EF-hand domain-containing protein n=1 Tax=Aphanomyces astaci TaxID=112090 RepID=A0A397DUP6_APHAT|nr:hypothetical protein DYB30_003013 [Aphanomyces astaci]RHZ38061.1 hypothetical protein DYB31_011206 [Aphanomyces astaci]RHZ40751.1 hypothetical protein DYB26_001071 [Aphanomyces astaci]
MAREDERARILDSLEHTAVLIKQSEGEADGYHAAYFLQEKDDEDVLNSSHLFLPTSTVHCMRLSDLGIQKCAQIFHRFDDDRDGVWGFVEFKAYVTVLRGALAGRVSVTYLTGNADDNHSDRGDYVLKLDVGKDFAAHAELQLSYTADCDSSATLYNLGYREDGAECFVYFDFLTKSDITDVELNDTIAAMSTLLDVGFHDHLQSLPWFHKALVVSPPKTHAHSGGGSAIVRVVILLTDALDPFNLLLFLGFPPSLQFDHLLSRLRWNAMLNVSLHDIFTNKRFNAAKHFALRSALNVCVGRQACGQTLQTMNVNVHVATIADLIHGDSVLHTLFHRDTIKDALRVCFTTGSLHALWTEWSTSLENELHEMFQRTCRDVPSTATTWFRQEHALHKSLLHVYDTITSNLIGLNVVKGEAGTIGMTLLLEGFNVLPLLPKLHTTRTQDNA